MQTDFTLDSVIFCQAWYKRPIFKGKNNIWYVMNLVILRVLFKKAFAAIKRLQFQVNVVSCKNKKTNLVNMKQNLVTK